MTRHDRAPGTHAGAPDRLSRLALPGRAGTLSARGADLALIAKAPPGFLDTTHFDTVRFPPPPWAVEAFASAARDGERAYSPYRGHGDVREAVARSTQALLGIPVDPARNVILTAGTQSALFAALSSLAGSAPVAMLSPEYLFDERMLRFLGAEVRHVPLRIEEACPDLDALEAAFRAGARTFVVSNPHNPTGTVLSAEAVTAIARLAVRHDVRVVADELYCRLLHDDAPFRHLAAESGMAERTVTLLGPSKTESLSGYRLGVAVGPEDLVARMEDVLSVTALRAPAYAQSLLAHWLEKDAGWLAERLPAFTALRATTGAALRRLPWLGLRLGPGTAYAWPDVSALGLPATEVAERLLVDAGVLVSPGYQFGPNQEGRFRVCYARDEAQWDAALERMVAVLDGLGRRAGLPPATA